MEFEQIYNTYFKAVYRYIWQLSGNEHIAEEITGETFFKAMKSINNFRGECGDVAAYGHIREEIELLEYHPHPLAHSVDINIA